MTNRPGHRVRLASGLTSLLATAALLLTAACTTTRGPSPDSTMNPNLDQQFQELMTRPDIEEISQRYEQMAATIRDQLVVETGLPPWQADTGSRSSCRAYPDVDTADKESRGLPIWTAQANISDDNWPRAVQIVTEIAIQNGFGPPTTIVDMPGRHEVSLEDGYGAGLAFGTRVNTTMLIQTGCHLTAKAHKRGKPTDAP